MEILFSREQIAVARETWVDINIEGNRVIANVPSIDKP